MPVLGAELRDALAIRRHDVGFDGRIVGLLPHAYAVQHPDGTIAVDVRTHPKYAKRLYHQLLPIWRAAHAWDRFLAEPLVPALDLGFSTLTAFPDADPETTTCDGIAFRGPVSEVWSTIRNGAGLSARDANAIDNCWYIQAETTLDNWQYCIRSLFGFDTSSLGVSASISAAVLSVFGSAKADALGATPTMDVYTATPAANTAVAAADYGNIGTTSQTGAPMAYASQSAIAYNDLAFNATGIASINKTGVSNFAIRNANFDVANLEPTWVSGAASKLDINYADQTGTTNDPKLVVTFTIVTGSPGLGRYGLWQSNAITGNL